jgi:hypothetical protein
MRRSELEARHGHVEKRLQALGSVPGEVYLREIPAIFNGWITKKCLPHHLPE